MSSVFETRETCSSKKPGILTIPKYRTYPEGEKMRISDSLYFCAIKNILILSIFFTEYKNIEYKNINKISQVSRVASNGSLCNRFTKASICVVANMDLIDVAEIWVKSCFEWISTVIMARGGLRTC